MSLSDSDGFWANNRYLELLQTHLVRKRTLNHLAKVA